MVQDIIQFTRLADITPTKRGNLPLLFSAGLNGFVMFYWLVSIHKLLHVILSPSTGSGQAPRRISADPSNYEILRRIAPQNDTHKRSFRMGTSYTEKSDSAALDVNS